ncbi:butyrate kinase [Haloimpatiens sp. FM7315]|uniref:butyrate kinase n=1 Tax=Haloimpatiens sp. FM7315 TaxID=3298609 RepID=UPI003977E1A4
MMRILVINPGATSTKISIFEDKEEILKKNIEHSASDLAPFEHIIDQFQYRKDLISKTLKEEGFKVTDFNAVCGRGGLLRHIPSGTYEVTDKVIQDIYNPPYGEHASNLGTILAKAIAEEAGIKAYFVDPVSVDEMTDVARVTGFSGMERESFFHALNQKSMGRKASLKLGKKYEEVNLIVVHMGGGVSVAAHEKGRVIDVYNVKDEGSFSMDRGGSLPVNALINFCFSGKTKKEVKKALGSKAGVFSYLGTRDFREVEIKAFSGDEKAKLIFDALVYQHCKDIGAMAAVLKFNVDAIVLTAGMAHSKKLCSAIADYVGKLAPIIVLPGEEEMKSLAEGALRVLNGELPKEY